jgi:trehalose 6-phosphate phosphatase
MRYLLSAAGTAALRRFAQPKTLLALDYDGTLVSIADHPSHAHMRASTRRLLTSIVQQYPSIVITGRARQDAQRFLAGISPIEIVGNHGLEDAGGGPQSFVKRVAGWRRHLTRRLDSILGLVIEDKRYSLSVHYRRCKKPATVRKVVMDAVRELEGVRIIGGKAVINLVPVEASHKGVALLSAMKRTGCLRAIYVGDDDTDEDVFAVAKPDRIFSIRVGRRHDSQAQFYLRGQSEMDYLLKLLLARR